MPTISIKEVDISTVGSSDVTTNVAYVPGYAIQGPTNVPTMCRTLEEFQEIFGTAPYIFKEGGSNGSEWVYSWKKGRPEVSYVYAAELVKMGLPILFERVPGVAGTAKSVFEQGSTQVGEIKAKYSGESYQKVYYTLSKETQVSGGTSYDGYTLTVGRTADKDLGITEISPVKTFFTFSEEYRAEYPKYSLFEVADSDSLYDGYYYTDNSNLVEVAFNKIGDPLVNPTIDVVSENTYLEIEGYDPETATDEFTPAAIYDHIEYGLSPIKDRNEYVIKYITAGGYPTLFQDGTDANSTYCQKLLDVAVARKDITAIIDYDINLDNSKNAISVRELADKWVSALPLVDNEEQGNYGAVFTPWGTHKSQILNNVKKLPSNEIVIAPSFAYLSALANSTQTYANWYAVAGITRGLVPTLVSVNYNISDYVGNIIQPKDGTAINPIQMVRPYGYRIWGSRTLRPNKKYSGLMATSFLNIRQLANDIKRTVYVASKECMFEPDDDVLWVNYKSKITPLLDQMKGNRGLTTYTIKRVATNEKATVKAVITAYCIDPVESFDITLELSDDQITVSE